MTTILNSQRPDAPSTVGVISLECVIVRKAERGLAEGAFERPVRGRPVAGQLHSCVRFSVDGYGTDEPVVHRRNQMHRMAR